MNNLQVARVAMTAARITWEAPNLEGCDSFRGYQIYLSKFEGNKPMKILLYFLWLDDVEHECVTDCVVILSSLSASTTYQVDVCAVTSKGKGPKATIDLVTASAGKSVTMIDDKMLNFSFFKAIHILQPPHFRHLADERFMLNGNHPK